VDDLAGSGLLGSSRVFMQLGHEPDFVPRHSQWRPFMGAHEFAESLRQAEVIVTHGGAGTLREVLRLGKTPVVMPRRKRHGEHVDDHQLELVQAYAERDLVIPAYEREDLPGAIERARLRATAPLSQPDSPLIGLVARAIEELLAARASRDRSRNTAK
jgi:UDP-N-acetylglucosamine transferase subunit ALG13